MRIATGVTGATGDVGAMSALMEHNDPEFGTSVRVLERTARSFGFEWHQHQEYELTLITRSTGRRFVGDQVTRYAPGDLTLIGPMLPHTWVSDEGSHAGAVVVHFGASLLGAWPEATAVATLLRHARTGIQFADPARAEVAAIIEGIASASPLQRIVKLVDVLDRLSGPSVHRQRICRPALAFGDDARVERVLAHVERRFREQLTQRECADLVGLTPSVFCRLFKSSMHRTFTQYVNDLRTDEACRLLASGQQRVTSIAFLAGFENLSYFNRVFRRTKGMSPSAYREASRHGWAASRRQQRRSA